ncbi:putative mannan endo-1,4-beta-mannosidase 9 [Wolffia australiana]
MGKQYLRTLAFIFLAISQSAVTNGDASRSFAKTNGTQFVINGQHFYANGFNAYWFMQMASDIADRTKVSSAFLQASLHGMNLARTWAFSDGGSRPLQISPGVYNEAMFKGLDFTVAEAKKHGVYLILSLSNNYNDFGGKNQYVQWARQSGENLNSDDDFFRSDLAKAFYKNNVKAVISRVNTFTGLAYKDDPTIFAWELINEPRCPSDLSGRTLQAWMSEMAAYVKSIDANHLLEVGMEGFYGESWPEKKAFNPGYEVGTDFIANHQIPGIDFATIHAYPDQWSPGSGELEQQAFLRSWIASHVQDCARVLRKPLLIAEFGKSTRSASATQRDVLFNAVYDAVFSSALAGGPASAAAFWHLLVEGMEGFADGYEVVLSQSPSTAGIISQQSRRMAGLNKPIYAELLTP